MTDKRPDHGPSHGQEQSENRVTVRTPTLIERAIRRKWLLYGGAAVVGLYAVAVMMAGRDDPPPPEPEPEFIDTTPDVRASEEVTLARLQRELRETERRLAEQREAMAARDDAHRREIEALREALTTDQEALLEAIDRLERERDEQPEAETSTADIQETTPDAFNPSGYIRPPRITDDGLAVPPPPLSREERERAALPPRTAGEAQGPARPERDAPWVLDGSEQPDERVLTAPETSEDETEDEFPMAGFLPMGAFSEIAMLTGADFGASDRVRSNPQPVLMRVQDDAFLPGRARYHLADCFAMGSGYGDMSSERAYIQLARLSCVDQRTGQMLETQIQGYVVDSDGSLGLRGTVSRRSGAVLGKAMLAGFADGASRILSAAATGAEQTVTGSGVVTSIDSSRLGEAGLYGGAGRAAELLAEQYIEEAENMFPVIEIPAGRKGTVVVQVGQRLEWQAYEPRDLMPEED